jgi:anti-sigma B factor antagonist
MTLTTTLHEPVAILSLDGVLDAPAAKEFNAEAQAALHQGARHIVVDLADLKTVSDAGLTGLIRVARHVQKTGGRLALAAANAAVRENLDAVGLRRSFLIFSSVDAAEAELARDLPPSWPDRSQIAATSLCV